MEILLVIGLAVYILVTTQSSKNRPPTRLNPNDYHDKEAFCQRYNRIAKMWGIK